MLIYSRTVRADEMGAFASIFSEAIKLLKVKEMEVLSEALINFYRNSELEDLMRSGSVLECAIEFDRETSSVRRIDYELIEPPKSKTKPRGFKPKSR
jgi:hypothetical protein